MLQGYTTTEFGQFVLLAYGIAALLLLILILQSWHARYAVLRELKRHET
jgi:heme exporter protein CcmD